MSDASSVCSSHSATSVSLSKMECPYCNKDLQVRGMFAHIRKLHHDELLKSTNRRWITEAENGSPLRVWWTKKNDFDEEELTILYVCLGSNKTFTTAYGCQQHFKKDKTALKEHNKELKQLKKDFEAHKKAQAKASKQKVKTDPYMLRRINAFNTNDPELARSIWRGILNNKKVCELSLYICNKSRYYPSTPMYFWDKKQKMFEEIRFDDFNVCHEKLMTKVETLLETKCMDVMLLHKVFCETLCFWDQNYRESIMGFPYEMKALYPIYNYQPDQKFFDYAIDEMPGVDF